MAIHNDTSISCYGSMTEIDALQTIIDYLTSFDGITCDTTAQAQFSEPTGVAEFNFRILHNNAIFRIKRGADNSTRAQAYIFSSVINGVEYTTQSRSIWYQSIAPTETFSSRQGSTKTIWRFKILISSNVCFLYFQHATDNPPTSILPNEYSVAVISDGNSYYMTSKNGSDITVSTFTEVTTNNTVSLYKVLNYSARAGTISMVRENPLISGSGFVANAKDIAAVTTLSAGTEVALDTGENYYCIASNFMIPIG